MAVLSCHPRGHLFILKMPPLGVEPRLADGHLVEMIGLFRFGILRSHQIVTISVQRAHRRGQIRGREVGIFERGLEARVAEQLLDRFDRDAALNEPRGIGVSQVMNPRMGNARCTERAIPWIAELALLELATIVVTPHQPRSHVGLGALALEDGHAFGGEGDAPVPVALG